MEPIVEAVRVEIAVLELKRGDILVVKLPHPVWEVSDGAEEKLHEFLPDGVKVILATTETEFSVIRESEVT